MTAWTTLRQNAADHQRASTDPAAGRMPPALAAASHPSGKAAR